MIKKLIKKFPKLHFFIYYNYIWKPKENTTQYYLNRYSRKFKKEIFFIQVGANDGISGDFVHSGDPIHKFIIRDKWSGILVEPVPYLAEKLRKNYTSKKLSIFNGAISENKETKKFYYVDDPDQFKEIPWWFNQLNSFNKEMVYGLKARMPEIEKYIREIDIDCLTLNDLIAKFNVKKIDLLHIDTEGYDFKILKTLDFNNIQPNMILFENRHLKEDEKRDSINLLKKHNYHIIIEEFDTFGIKESVFKSLK